jgi:glycosyltransferase involved in cell wall biosynthesis
MNRPFFSIILPTYNRLNSLRKISLASFNLQESQDFEIIIVDDNSTDGTEEYFQKDFLKEHPNLAEKTLYFKNRENKGAPVSRNIGANKAMADWLFITEDDVQIEDPGFVEKAKKIITGRDQKQVIISPKRAEIFEKWNYIQKPNILARLGRLSAEVYIDPTQEFTGEVETTHATVFIKTETYLNHLEDENLVGSTYRDETDLYLHITRDGGKIFYCGDVLKVKHRCDLAASGGQKSKKKSMLKSEILVWRNHYYFLQKHFSWPFLRLIVFIKVRMVKHLADLSGLKILKKMLTYWNV